MTWVGDEDNIYLIYVAEDIVTLVGSFIVSGRNLMTLCPPVILIQLLSSPHTENTFNPLYHSTDVVGFLIFFNHVDP